MADKFRANIPSHRITAREAFFDRRQFLSRLGGLGGLGLGLLATPALLRASAAVTAQRGMLQPPLERPGCLSRHAQPGIHDPLGYRAARPDGARDRRVT